MITIQLKANEEKRIRKYAKLNNLTVSKFIRKTVLEKIEDEYELQIYRKAISEHKKNPVTYSHKIVRKILGL